MSTTSSIPRVVREGDSVAIAVGDRSMAMTVAEAKHLARAASREAKLLSAQAQNALS